jgi:hypothetical protein
MGRKDTASHPGCRLLGSNALVGRQQPNRGCLHGVLSTSEEHQPAVCVVDGADTQAVDER